MTLLQKIRTLGYAVLLALTPAQMSCGDFLTCEKDYDCEGERVCRKVENTETGEKIFTCIDPQPPQHSSAEPVFQNACDDSPLTGQYLVSTGCRGGTPIAFGEFPCRGSWVDHKNEFPLDYRGMTLLGKEILSRSSSPETAVITLRRDLMRENFGTFEEYFSCDEEDAEGGAPPCYGSTSGYSRRAWEVDIARMLCYLEENENFFLAEVNDRVVTRPDMILELSSSPWLGEDFCRTYQDNSWKEQCDEENPYPEF